MTKTMSICTVHRFIKKKNCLIKGICTFICIVTEEEELGISFQFNQEKHRQF